MCENNTYKVHRYILDKATNSWKPRNEDYEFDGTTYFHTNENSVFGISM